MGDHYLYEEGEIYRIGRRRRIWLNWSMSFLAYHGKLVGVNFKFRKDFP